MTLGDRSDASADREALLALLLAEEGIELASTAIGRRDQEQPAVLSFAQERMWFLDQFEEDTAALGVRTAVALHGPLDVPVLRRCLDEIARRHDVLRTVIVADGGQPRPVVLPVAPMPVVEHDVHGDLAELGRVLEGEAARTFDLEHEPPILVTIVRVGEGNHVLSVVMHHVASDGWSFAVFFRELAALYGVLRDGRPSPLPELAVQYEDYAWWQRHGASEVFERQLDYWRQQLAGPLPVCEIPTDHRRPARQTFAGGQVSGHLPSALVARLEDLGKSCGATLFMTLLAAFEVVVARHAGQREVLLGTPVAGRVRPELEPMIGAFLNTLVIRDDLGGDPSFRTVLERVRATSLDALENQDVPFELLLADLKPPRDLSRTPLFQIFFNMTNLDVGGTAFDLRGIRTEVIDQPGIGSKFDLTMYVNDGSDGVDLLLVYNRSLFERSHMECLAAQYADLIEQVAADPDRHIEELSLVTPQDAAVLPDAGSALDRTWHGSLPDAVRRVAARSPERVAVVDPAHRWTFALLSLQMNRLATWLKLRRLGRGEVVAIYAHRSGSLVWAVAGVLASGAVYLLLDPRYPPPRLAQLLRIARPKAFLALDAAGAPPPEVLEALDELRVEHRLTIPEIADLDELDRLLWGAGGSPSGAPVDGGVPFDDDIGPDDPACLTFTSGSTGVPKAVVGRHGSLTHFFPWMSERFGVGEDDRFSMLSGLAHDPLQREMFWPLWLGATVVVPEPDSIPDPGWLAGWMREQEISVAHFTPAMGQLLTDGARPGGPGTQIPSLRTALFIGDVLPRGEVTRIQAVAPNVRVVNLYGTTETQRASGYHVLAEEAAHPSGAEAREVLPLGTGMPGAQLLVRTRTGAPAGVGEVGEIVMRSPHLALGYWDDADLTAARFAPDPAGSHPSDQCYATGDLGRYRVDGSVEFLGRGDQQVKLRGFRIELGEIQAALREHDAVGDAVVELRDDGPAGAELVAYVVPTGSGRVEGPELLRWTRARLPAHLVPAHVVFLERIPMTPNGKLDRRALPPPGAGPARADGSPHDALERLLVQVWERVLGRKGISVHDDFFSLGGYSLLATRLFAVVEDRTGQRVPVSVLFEHPTIAELAAVIRDGGWRTNWSSLVPIQPAGSAQPFFYVAPYMISVLQLAPLGDELGRDRPLYGLQPQGLDGTLPAHRCIEDMAEHYITELKTVQPQGPYALGGHCSGAWVAFEMARQLEAAGDEISALLLVDQGPPGVERPRIDPKRYIANRLRFYLRDGRLRHAMAWQFKILGERLLLRRVGPRAARFEEEVKAVHRQAFRAYGGGQISQDMTLVCSAESLALADKSWYTRWSDRTSGRLTTRHVAGTHANLLVRPYVLELGREVKRALGERDGGAPAR